MIFPLLIAAVTLGAVWVYIIPFIQGWVAKFVPADILNNKIVQVAATGAFIMIALWIATLVVKKTKSVVK